MKVLFVDIGYSNLQKFPGVGVNLSPFIPPVTDNPVDFITTGQNTYPVPLRHRDFFVNQVFFQLLTAA
jgi:hypothetical protein